MAIESLLMLDPGRGFATPARARRFLFSPELDEEAVRRYVKLLGRESFRALMELGHLRPDAARVRRTPLLVLGAERDYIVSPPTSGAPRRPTVPRCGSCPTSRTT